MKALNKNSKRGFTLIEMVGVLAVIAILAALLVPKVMAAISDSKYSNTVASINSVKTATMSYYAKNTSFTPTNAFDTVLLSGGFIDQAFAVKVGTGTALQVVAAPGGVGGAGYKLDGVNLLTAASNTSWVVECVITNVPAADAVELSSRIDGVLMSTNGLAADSLGRVTYAAPDATGLTTVYVYVTSK